MNFQKLRHKLQNNRFLALQTHRHSYLFITIWLLISSSLVYSQDIPPKNELDLPAKDTLTTKTVGFGDIISEKSLGEAALDTVKNDTIKLEPEVLTDIVDYYGEDYVYIDREENKVYLYNKAYVIYGDVQIDAGLIIIDNNKNEVYAKGIDSLGKYTQSPIFVQGTNEVRPDSIRFNQKTEKALVYNSRTEQNGFNVIAEVTKKINDSVVFLKNVKFTTSKNIDDPEYYFYTRRAKFVPKKKIVTGLTNMYIADVPTPIGLPFAFFPLTEDRTSGIIIPTIGENSNRGFFFQNGGYYFAINDYLDLTVLGDYYTNGSYALRGESSYAVRYRFNGNVSVRYENLITSERGFPSFAQNAIYNIRWSHSQDAKSSPSSRFSASVNLGSSKYFQQSASQTNNASGLINTLNSSVSYSKTFEGEPQVNLAITGTHTQNTQTEQITMSLPNVTASMSRIFPFAPKNGTKKGIIDNINFQYDVTAQNRFVIQDSLFFKPEMFEKAQLGARHTIPISTNFKVFKYLSASAGTTFQETWVGKTIRREYDPLLEGGGGVVTDTVSGFDAFRTYNFATSIGTTIYGTFNTGDATSKIQKVRHVMRPSIGYSINPAFDEFYDSYVVPAAVAADSDVSDEIIEYSRFEGSLYGRPSNTFSNNLSFALSNTLEAKVKNKDSTALEPKKVILLNNLNFRTSYNLAGDSLKWSPVSVSGSIPIVPKLEFNFSGTLDPYALDNSNNKIDKFNIDNGGSLFRFTNGNVSLNYSFSSKDFETTAADERKSDETFRNGGRKDDLFGESGDIYQGANLDEDEDNDRDKPRDWYNYDIPWTLRVAYTMTYGNTQRQNEIQSQSVMVSSNLELSPRWTVGVSSGYDFKQKGITSTQFRFQRDLESWKMSFNWTPIGAFNTSWYFFVGISSSVLSDIKYDKRREPDQGL